MSVLTVTPSRFADFFPDGSYAYCFADRPVTKLGQLITPIPITVFAVAGVIQFDLEPNSEVDERSEFRYIVSAYTPEAGKLYTVALVMPTTDTDIFELIEEPIDPDLCTQTPLVDNS